MSKNTRMATAAWLHLPPSFFDFCSIESVHIFSLFFFNIVYFSLNSNCDSVAATVETPPINAAMNEPQIR